MHAFASIPLRFQTSCNDRNMLTTYIVSGTFNGHVPVSYDPPPPLPESTVNLLHGSTARFFLRLVMIARKQLN